MSALARIFRCALEVITVALLIVLAIIVVTAVVFRYSGMSLIWYDEVASVMLAWITYYGAALASANRNHLGFSGLVYSLPLGWRYVAFVVAEVITFTFFVVCAWASWRVLDVMAGETLISLRWVPLQFTQSVVPIGCALYVVGQVLSLPEELRRIRSGHDREAEEISEAIEDAQSKMQQSGDTR